MAAMQADIVSHVFPSESRCLQRQAIAAEVTAAIQESSTEHMYIVKNFASCLKNRKTWAERLKNESDYSKEHLLLLPKPLRYCCPETQWSNLSKIPAIRIMYEPDFQLSQLIGDLPVLSRHCPPKNQS